MNKKVPFLILILLLLSVLSLVFICILKINTGVVYTIALGIYCIILLAIYEDN